MKNSKLVEEAKQNPGRIYHRPHDVLRDRRLDDAARHEILAAWAELADRSGRHPDLASGKNLLDAVNAARHELAERLPRPGATE